MPLLRTSLALVSLGLVTAAAADEKLARTDLAKRGKPATALVMVDPGGASGTAFVVHPDGLLVTNEHVVAAAANAPGGRVRVALRPGEPGEPGEKVVDARIVRTDKDRDLALLRVGGEKELPALPLGDSDKLTELTELVGFGFPYGVRPAPKKGDLPSVTVTVSSVASLRRKAGAVAEVQLDGALNAGHSGGPLLGADGTVAGVIRNGITGPGITQAIPANVLKAFLAVPDVTLTPPKLDRPGLNKPAEFRADVVFLVPGTPRPSVELVLETGDGPPRRVPMELKAGAYRASAVPVPRPDPVTVGLTARYGPVTIAGPVADRAVTVGGKAVQLSQLRRLELGGSPKAVTVEGETLSGPVAELDGVEVRLADQVVKLDLAKADGVDLVPPAEPAVLTWAVVVTAGGKEVGRDTVTVSVPGSALRRPAGAAPVASPAALEADRVVRQLPDKFSDVCAGGGGRFLLFHLPKPGKIALFDVSQAKVVHQFPAPDAGVKFAAGADKLVIGLPGQGILQRWSLTTFERELSVPFPTREPYYSILLGPASPGPVLVNGVILDLATLKPADIKVLPGRPGHPVFQNDSRGLISADGSVVGHWRLNSSPAGLSTAVLTGPTVGGHYGHITPGYVAPSADGRLVFTARAIYTADLKLVYEAKNGEAVYFLPAVHGNLYLGIRPAVAAGPPPVGQPGAGRPGGEPAAEVWAHLPGDNRPLVRVGRFKDDFEVAEFRGGERLGLFRRVWLIPDAKVLAILPTTNDAVHLTRFDLDEALEKAGTDYLFVASDPPAAARRGDRYTHQLVVKSKRGGVKHRLENGPKGMTVSATGLVDWRVPADQPAGLVTVIVSVADAGGHEAYKTFHIRVTD